MYRKHYSLVALLTLAAGMTFLGRAIEAQDARAPVPPDAKELQAKYQAEKQDVVQKGLAKRFPPVLIDRADELAGRADKALAEGRMLQAREGFRQARWQLPYQSPQVPAEHVAKVLGNLRLRHDAEVSSIAFSPDGKLIASASRDHTVKIWDLANGHELRTYTGHGELVRAVVFSPDGKAIVSAGAEPNIRVWDPLTGKDLRTIPGDGIYVTTLAFSNDGKHLFSGQAAKAINATNLLCVHEFESGKLLRKVEDFRLPIQSMNFSPDGTVLAVGAGDGQIRLWDYPRMVQNLTQPEYWSQQDDAGATYHVAISPDNKTLVRCGSGGMKLYNLPLPNDKVMVKAPRKLITPGPSSAFMCAVFSKDSKTLYVGASDGMVRMYDPDSGNAVGVFKGHASEIRAVMFHPSGGQLATASSDHTIRLWDSEVVMQSRDFAGHDGAVWKSSFSADGRRIVSASADKSVRIWDMAGGKVLHTLTGHRSAVAVALFSPDGKFIASGGGDKVVKIWDAEAGKFLRDLSGHQATITALDFSSDGKKLISAGVDRALKIWDHDTGKEVLSIDDNGSIPTTVAFSPDGKQIATGNVDQTIRLYDAATGKPQTSWSGHGTAVSGLAYSPDGKLLASCGADQAVRIWPLDKPGTGPITLSGHSGPVSAVAFRRDNQHVASCGGDMMVKLWKLEGDAGREVQNYRGHRDWLTSVAFSKDGFYLVSSGVDRVIKVWEITTREIPLLSEHTGVVQAVATSPDGKLIASGAGDHTIKLWDRVSGAELASLTGHSDAVTALIFSADSKMLVSAAHDRTLKVWDVATGKELPRQPGQQQHWTNLLSAPPLLSLTADGKTLLIWEPPGKAGNERFTKINAYELLTGKELFTFSDVGRNNQAVSFAADGKSVAIAARDGSMRIFDLTKKGQALPGGDWFLFDKAAATGDIALSPDGALLFAAGGKGEVKFCKVDGREVIKTIQAHAGDISSCLVSPDGKRLATFGQDNILKLWDVASGKELRRWSMQAPGDATIGRGLVLNLAFTPDGRQLVTANANTTLFVLDLP